MMRIVRFSIFFALFFAPVWPSIAGDKHSALEFNSSYTLPKVLTEVSGLAQAGPNSVFAHDDEHAIIHEIQLGSGKISRSFALGKPTAAGDFEAIAIKGDVIFLVTSKGFIYEAKIQPHRERASFNVYDTGLSEKCEVEGLSVTIDEDFYLLCKNTAGDPERKRLNIFLWSFKERLTPATLKLSIPIKDALKKSERTGFRASDLYVDPSTQNMTILNSGGPGLLTISSEGLRISYEKLAENKHRQAEGLAVIANNTIVVADEGKKRKAQLSIYFRQ